MDTLTIFSSLGGLVGLVGGICGVLSFINQRKQTKLIEQQFESARTVDVQFADSAAKFDEAVVLLDKIYSQSVTTGPSLQRRAEELVFPSRETRRRIERYLGKAKWLRRGFQPQVLTKEQLLNPVVQQVIGDVLSTVAEFRREHTDWARSLRLLE